MADQKDMSVFDSGDVNPYNKFFTGISYLKMLSTEQVPVGNVTFEPGCRNHWHIHHATQGGGQILLVTAGRGWYQHLAIEVPGEGAKTEWCEPVSDADYDALK